MDNIEQSHENQESNAHSADLQSPAEVNVPAWYSEDFAELVEKKGFKSADDALKSYKNLESMVGNSVRIPSEDASPEAKAEFLEKIKDVEGILLKNDENLYGKLGRPESSDGYNLEEIIDRELFNSMPTLADELDDFKELAFEAGLSKEQASKLVDMRMRTLKSFTEEHLKNREAAEGALRKSWGSDYDNRLAAAKQVIKIYGEKYGDHVTQLVNSPAGNNPALLNMLSELGEMYKEKKHEGMSGSHFGMTPDMAAAKIHEKRSDVGFLKAYNDDRHPGHKQAIAEMERLYRIANGESV